MARELYVVDRQETPEDLARAEEEARRNLMTWVSAFTNFPVENNLAGVAERLRKFQYAWMNGRKRP